VSLKRQGSATIAQLAEELELTGEAVRQQLLQLQREGWIEPKITRSPERSRTGRPATAYVLTTAGDHLFPKQYDALNVSMIDAVAEEFGEDAARRVLKNVAEAKIAATEPTLRGLSLPERIKKLKDWYLTDDPYMEIEEVGDGYRLVERNCPYINTAMRRPSVCSVSVNALSRLLGVRVVRDETFQAGHGRCAFHIYREEPVEATAEFQLEAEITR